MHVKYSGNDLQYQCHKDRAGLYVNDLSMTSIFNIQGLIFYGHFQYINSSLVIHIMKNQFMCKASACQYFGTLIYFILSVLDWLSEFTELEKLLSIALKFNSGRAISMML